MNHLLHKLNKNSSLIAKLILIVALTAATSMAAAEESSIAYVDSVLKWGAWELDIEPAAGGLSPPTTKVLNTRSSKVALRTNSISALAPPAPGGGTPVNPIVPGTPILPPVIPAPPFVPAAPTIPAPPGATPPTVVTLPPPAAPTSPAPSGATPPTVVTLP